MREGFRWYFVILHWNTIGNTLTSEPCFAPHYILVFCSAYDLKLDVGQSELKS